MPTDQTNLTPTDEARSLESTSEEFGGRVPTRDDLSPDGEGDGFGPLCNGMGMELMFLLSNLRRRRERLGLTVAQLAKRSRLTVEAIERLENRHNLNPRFDLVWRYALAMDALPTLAIEEVEPGPEEVEERADD